MGNEEVGVGGREKLTHLQDNIPSHRQIFTNISKSIREASTAARNINIERHVLLNIHMTLSMQPHLEGYYQNRQKVQFNFN